MNNIAKTIENFKTAYLAAAKEFNRIKADEDHSAEWKSKEIEKIAAKYNGQFDGFKKEVEDQCSQIGDRMDAARIAGTNGTDAGKAQFIINAISSGLCSVDDIKDYIKVFAGDFIVLNAIRAALLAKPEYKEAALLVPVDKAGDIKRKLARIAFNVNNVPPAEKIYAESDIIQMLYSSGSLFDELIMIAESIEE